MFAEERAAGEQSDGLRHRRLKETAELRILASVRRKELSEREEGGESPASVSLVARAEVGIGSALVGKTQVVARQSPAHIVWIEQVLQGQHSPHDRII